MINNILASQALCDIENGFGLKTDGEYPSWVEEVDIIRQAIKRAEMVEELIQALEDAKSEFWDEWHPHMSEEQFKSHWLIKQITSAIAKAKGDT